MSTQDIMKQKLLALMNKRYSELPLAKQKAQEEIEKLRKFCAAIDKEESELEVDISSLLEKISFSGVTQSNKSILDLPDVVWRKILTYFEGREYCLLNACLSSPSLEHLITNGSPTTKLRLLGEKVFSILILRYYVNTEDLQNCLNTTCQDLQFFAGSSWWCFNRSLQTWGNGLVFWKVIYFKNHNQIKELSQKVEQESNKWDFFKELRLDFSYPPTGSKSDYDKFYEAAISFQKTFGIFITYVYWSDSFPGNLHDICPDLQNILPRLKEVRWTINVYTRDDRYPYNSISSQLNYRTLEPTFIISGNLCVPKNSSINNSEGNIHGCKISSSTLKNSVQLVASKQLLIDMSSNPFSNIVDNYDNVLRADPSNFSTVTSLIVSGFTQHLRSIAMLEKFPNLTCVVLLGKEITDPPVINPPGPGLVFPRVKKLTFGFGINGTTVPLQPDILQRHFPSLRYLTIKDDNKTGFKDRMSKWHSEGHFNEGVIDVYRLYAENQSLKESNIWSEMPHLITLCVDTGEIFDKYQHLLGEEEDLKVYIRRQEMYRRIDSGRILLYSTFDTYSCH